MVYNPKTMTYRTIRNESKFQAIDKKDVAFYKEAEKTDNSIKVCEVNEEEFLYLNFNVEPKPTEEELIQMLIQNRNEMEESKEKPESNNSKVPKFGTNKKNTDTKQDEWNLSGSIEQCIIRYASRLNGEQINQILLGLEQGLTDEQVKSYFTLPADKMKQQRNMFRVM